MLKKESGNMKSEKYSAIEQSIISLRKHVSIFNDDEEIITEKHDMWSIKKLLVLRDYVPPFLRILRNNDFENIHFVDLFSGSGLLKINGKLMPGTSLVPLLTTKEIITAEGKIFFDEYYLSDIKQKYVTKLKERIKKLSPSKSIKINVEKMDFSNAVNKIFSGTQPKQDKKRNDAYLVVLDPYGFDVDWTHLERILLSGAVDIIITFPTRLARWNQTKQQSAEKLTSMFGSENWVTFTHEDEFVKGYCKKIEEVPLEWKFKTKAIKVQAGNMTYHLICVSRSKGALNVFSAMEKKFGDVTPKMLSRVFETAIGEQKTLLQFFE